MMMSLVKDVLANGDFGAFQAGALILFVSIMAVISVWIFLPGSKAYYDKVAKDAVQGDQNGV